MPDFVNMQGPENYSYLQDQGLAKNMGEILNVVLISQQKNAF